MVRIAEQQAFAAESRGRERSFRHYVVAGLRVDSELTIPTAAPSRGDANAQTDVTIRLGEEPSPIPKAKFRNAWMEIGTQEFAFRPRAGLAFLVRDGREITVSRAPGVSDADVYLFLMGSVWGVLCHQRELLPLHCSAIETQGRAIAFLGPSGSGKSTLAAGLLKRGYPHLCDDVGIVDRSGGQARLWPMPKGLKLWGDATEALDLTGGPVVGSSERWTKYFVPTQELAGEDCLEIAAFYVFDQAENNQMSISQLRGSRRFTEIASNLYRREWMTWIRDPAGVFQQVAKLAQTVPVYRFSRPWDLTELECGLTELDAHMGGATAPV